VDINSGYYCRGSHLQLSDPFRRRRPLAGLLDALDAGESDRGDSNDLTGLDCDQRNANSREGEKLSGGMTGIDLRLVNRDFTAWFVNSSIHAGSGKASLLCNEQ
jgi:hypothetical protein